MTKVLKNKKHLEELLRLGKQESPIYTTATGMVNGGSHHYWINSKNEVKCYGSGQGWSDQSDEVGNDENIEYWLSKLWVERKDINSFLKKE